jgi:protein-S-isoprenylcysteine O-methyltransferase Ste14
MKWLVLLLAVTAYGSYIWGAQFFFSSADKGAVRGKQRISLLVGGAIALNLGYLLLAPTTSTMLGLLALGLFAGSLMLFWCTVLTATSVPLAFLGSLQSPVAILQSGPYQWIRHPFYTSYILGWLGAALGSPHPLTWTTCIGLTLLYTRAAQQEENCLLLSPLGAEYSFYQSTTGMFFPRVG